MPLFPRRLLLYNGVGSLARRPVRGTHERSCNRSGTGDRYALAALDGTATFRGPRSEKGLNRLHGDLAAHRPWTLLCLVADGTGGPGRGAQFQRQVLQAVPQVLVQELPDVTPLSPGVTLGDPLDAGALPEISPLSNTGGDPKCPAPRPPRAAEPWHSAARPGRQHGGADPVGVGAELRARGQRGQFPGLSAPRHFPGR